MWHRESATRSRASGATRTERSPRSREPAAASHSRRSPTAGEWAVPWTVRRTWQSAPRAAPPMSCRTGATRYRFCPATYPPGGSRIRAASHRTTPVPECGAARALDYANAVEVDQGGRNVYVAAGYADAIAVFERGADGSLTQEPPAAAHTLGGRLPQLAGAQMGRGRHRPEPCRPFRPLLRTRARPLLPVRARAGARRIGALRRLDRERHGLDVPAARHARVCAAAGCCARADLPRSRVPALRLARPRAHGAPLTLRRAQNRSSRRRTSRSRPMRSG